MYIFCSVSLLYYQLTAIFDFKFNYKNIFYRVFINTYFEFFFF